MSEEEKLKRQERKIIGAIYGRINTDVGWRRTNPEIKNIYKDQILPLYEMNQMVMYIDWRTIE